MWYAVILKRLQSPPPLQSPALTVPLSHICCIVSDSTSFTCEPKTPQPRPLSILPLLFMVCLSLLPYVGTLSFKLRRKSYTSALSRPNASFLVGLPSLTPSLEHQGAAYAAILAELLTPLHEKKERDPCVYTWGINLETKVRVFVDSALQNGRNTNSSSTSCWRSVRFVDSAFAISEDVFRFPPLRLKLQAASSIASAPEASFF